MALEGSEVEGARGSGGDERRKGGGGMERREEASRAGGSLWRVSAGGGLSETQNLK